MSQEDGYIHIKGKRYQVVTLDFETFYGKGYTLTGKINTSEYIRDERFHPHGVGIKIGAGRTKWYTGIDIDLALKEINWSKSAMLAHNTPFDGFICSHHNGIVPAFYLDTLAMARGAHGHHMRHDLDTIAKSHGFGGKVKREALANTRDKLVLTAREQMSLGGYCLDDVDDCYGVFWKLFDFIPEEELRLIDLTTRMFCDPVLKVNTELVQEELDEEVGGKVAALLASGATVEDLMSNIKFAKLLTAAGAKPPMKISPTTGKQTFAFARSDLDFQALAKNGSVAVRALCDARLKVKSTIGETRAVRFLEAGKDGLSLPVLLHYAGAHTLRWSGGNKMNMQNLKRGGKLRLAITAPKGYRIVVADSAQIEARVLAWLAGQVDLVKGFANREDVYKAMASSIFGVPVEEVTKDQRFVGKVCVLGLGFGMGAVKLQLTLEQGVMGPPVIFTVEECQRIVDIYRRKNHKIKAYWKVMDGLIASMLTGHTGDLGPISYGKGYVRLPNGMFLQYPGLSAESEERGYELVTTNASYLTRNGRGKLYGGLLTENIVQALARCIIAEQLLAVTDAGYRVVMTTHDEIVVVCKAKAADKCLREMLTIMSTPPDWAQGLPLAAEGGHDVNYSK